MLRIALAALHLIALGFGLGAVIARAAALRDVRSPGALRLAFRADASWGIAAFLWIGSGVWRLVAGLEKPATYYMLNHFFYAKMGLLVLVLALEVWPMVTLIRWRIALKAGGTHESVADPFQARSIAIISDIQAALIVAMVFLAVAMARGYGIRSLQPI